VIAAMSVVCINVLPNLIMAGVLARLIKEIDNV